ncbi:hypothetical protein J0H33_14450 [bacterium]|nr:hypothetical protein [bacterium]
MPAPIVLPAQTFPEQLLSGAPIPGFVEHVVVVGAELFLQSLCPFLLNTVTDSDY